MGSKKERRGAPCDARENEERSGTADKDWGRKGEDGTREREGTGEERNRFIASPGPAALSRWGCFSRSASDTTSGKIVISRGRVDYIDAL